MEERHESMDQRPRLRRMIYSLFAVYWILVGAALVLPQLFGGAGEGADGTGVVALVFLTLLLIALANSLSLAYLAFRFRGALAFPDLVVACLPLTFSMVAIVALWSLA